MIRRRLVDCGQRGRRDRDRCRHSPAAACALAVAALAVALGGCDARIGEPRALWALWLLPALVVFYLLSLRARAARLRRLASPPMLERLTGGASARRSVVKAALVVAAVIALLVSLARLQMGYTWEEVQRRGVDIVVALDVSDSMRVEDAGRALSRLERAKRELHDLLQLLAGDRIGIVAFAGTAFVQCPMTLDYGAAELFLDALDPESIPVQGTDLAQALETSLRAFRGGAAGSRAVLLITDGEDHSGRAVEVAQRLRAEGVRVFGIGIGSEAGAPIPAPGGGFRRDRAGDIILSRLDEATLQQIALTTDGRYVRSVSGDLDLEQIYVEGIKATLEDREFEAHRRQRWEDRFQWLLAAAIAALMIEAVIAERAAHRRARRTSSAGYEARRSKQAVASGGVARGVRKAAGAGAAGAAPQRAASAPRRAASVVVLTLVLLVPAALRAGGQPGGEADGDADRPRAQEGARRQSGGERSALESDHPAAAREPARFDTPEEAYHAGEYETALEGFVELQVERPEDTAVTMNVGSSHYRLGDLDAAARSFEAAGAAGDDRLRAQAWYDLGNVAYRQGRLEEAIESYHRSLDLDPSDQDAKFNLEVTRAALERQQQQQQQQRQQQQQQLPGGENEEPQAGGEEEPSPQSGGGGDSKQEPTAGRDDAPSNADGNEQQGEQRNGDQGERPGSQVPRQAGDEAGGDGQPRRGKEGQLSAAEAQRLLDALEEGRPRRRVPPGRHRDQEKDW
jgi:Ca-activated chloride channel homolog